MRYLLFCLISLWAAPAFSQDLRTGRTLVPAVSLNIARGSFGLTDRPYLTVTIRNESRMRICFARAVIEDPFSLAMFFQLRNEERVPFEFKEEDGFIMPTKRSLKRAFRLSPGRSVTAKYYIRHRFVIPEVVPVGKWEAMVDFAFADCGNPKLANYYAESRWTVI